MPDDPIEPDPDEAEASSDSLAELARVLRSRRHATRGQPAEFGERMGSKFFDLIVALAFGGCTLAITMLLVMGGMPDSVMIASAFVSVICHFGIGTMNLLPEGSPGKRANLLRIMTPDGADAPFGRLLARWAVQVVAGYGWTIAPVLATLNVKPAGHSLDQIGASLMLVTMVIVLANIILLMTRTRRTLHDLISGTVVGSAQSVPEEPTQAFEVIPLIASGRGPHGD